MLLATNVGVPEVSVAPACPVDSRRARRIRNYVIYILNLISSKFNNLIHKPYMLMLYYECIIILL